MPPSVSVFLSELSDRITVDPSGCWLWTGAKHPTGYGIVKVAGKQWVVHRYVSTLVAGEIPTETHILHSCDTPLCSNPAHLWRGSHADNMADKRSKGRTSAPAVRLTQQQVQEIRSLYAAGGVSYSSLANQFGVSKETIGAIIRRHTWTTN